jgi:hypothetical protein
LFIFNEVDGIVGLFFIKAIVGILRLLLDPEEIIGLFLIDAPDEEIGLFLFEIVGIFLGILDSLLLLDEEGRIVFFIFGLIVILDDFDIVCDCLLFIDILLLPILPILPKLPKLPNNPFPGLNNFYLGKLKLNVVC